MSVKDVFGSIFVLIITNLFTYITGKLMLILQANTNSRSPRSIFRKMILNKPTFANNFDFIWIFSYSHSLSPLVVTKH